MSGIQSNGDWAGDSGLRVLCLMDLHWSGREALRLPPIREVDLLVLGGDLTHFQGGAAARALLREFEATGLPVLAICGNCDRPEIEATLEEAGVALDRRSRTVAGVTFVGISGGLPFGGCPYERSEEEFEAACNEALSGIPTGIEREPVVLVSHQPPFGTCCDRARGRHVGSQAVRAAVERHRPDIVICGHIHEAIGQDKIGSSEIVNPGPWFAGHYLELVISSNRIELSFDGSPRQASLSAIR